jgi:hypothetical protein
MASKKFVALSAIAVIVVAATTSLLSQAVFQMQVIGKTNGLRVQTDQAGGLLGSFGGFGDVQVDLPGIPGGRLALKENGNVGIGNTNPGQKLSVGGTVESTVGGFKFPDGTVLTSANNGTAILTNRIISTTLNDHIVRLPGFGDFNVVSCDHTNAVFQWSSGGPVAYVTEYDVYNPGDTSQGVANIVTSNGRPRHFSMWQLARDVGTNTSMATVTVTTNAADCVFAAQAIVRPG